MKNYKKMIALAALALVMIIPITYAAANDSFLLAVILAVFQLSCLIGCWYLMTKDR
ncbi:membrane protein [Arthrobacter phage Racecar]|nr:hypothetical protein PBI_RACECAR_25 [Arthrobacter phage Racecar]QFG12709.1 hypothetical protein PBI_MIMI_25 [Arthrobacter phage Mimi]